MWSVRSLKLATISVILTTCAVRTPVAQVQYDLIADFGVVVAESPRGYGTNLWWTDQDAGLWASRWTELEPSLVRVAVLHPQVEPVNDNDDPGVINWSGFLLDVPISIPGTTRTMTYRSWFQALRDQPTRDVLLFFPYLAPWLSDRPPHTGLPIPAAPHPPSDLAEYREFIKAVLLYLTRTLGFPPERIMVEAMNEPDLECGADPVVPCFWSNWTMADLADVVRVTYEAIQAVDADIRLVGLSECCGTGLVRTLLDYYPEGAYLDVLSYHYYSPAGHVLDPALDRASTLAPHGLPIYLDEYGSLQYRSEGTDGALWHSWALATMWKEGIAPVQYPISEWPLQGEPYNSMGLFEDWRGDWLRKPAYWVFVNFFAHLGGSQVISNTGSVAADVLVGRRFVGYDPVRAQVVFWFTNRSGQPLTNLTLAVRNFPSKSATLREYDNLGAPLPVMTTTISGSPLVFAITLPARSSGAFVLEAEMPARLFLPLVVQSRSAR